MDKNSIRADLWAAIESHYEKKDFTESIRDAMFFISEIVRDNSGLEDKDGVKLIEAAFLGKNPSLLINNNQTDTERNIQEGIGYALKGLIMSIRNPISHERVTYSEDSADAILLYTNYLLKIIDKSKGKT
ncbi:MAG: TIGR02391 family protein, partial [Bacillota bacterium]